MAVFFSHFGDIQCQTMRDLGNQVSGRSRSLKIAPFDRPHATLYSSAIVNIALSRTVFEFFDVELYRDFEIGARGHSMSLKLVRAIRKLGCGFLFAFYSNCGRICSRL